MGLDSGWEDMVGVENVRQKVTLHWIDGPDESIFEDDFADAREYDGFLLHFRLKLTTI